ncbi:hypothetical protein D3C84_872580 [compost metagenome]
MIRQETSHNEGSQASGCTAYAAEPHPSVGRQPPSQSSFPNPAQSNECETSLPDSGEDLLSMFPGKTEIADEKR